MRGGELFSSTRSTRACIALPRAFTAARSTKRDSLRDALIARSKELDRGGFHAQVKVTGESTLLFYNVDGRRLPLRSRNGKFTAGKASFTLDDLRAAIEKTPEAFSANVLLRPVVQDTLLPTAAYIGGPAEIAYMAQAQVVYKGSSDACPRFSRARVSRSSNRLLRACSRNTASK